MNLRIVLLFSEHIMSKYRRPQRVPEVTPVAPRIDYIKIVLTNMKFNSPATGTGSFTIFRFGLIIRLKARVSR